MSKNVIHFQVLHYMILFQVLEMLFLGKEEIKIFKIFQGFALVHQDI